MSALWCSPIVTQKGSIHIWVKGDSICGSTSILIGLFVPRYNCIIAFINVVSRTESPAPAVWRLKQLSHSLIY